MNQRVIAARAARADYGIYTVDKSFPLSLLAQFQVEIEATACCDFGVDGYRPSIPNCQRDP
jgi:hypothetical protein